MSAGNPDSGGATLQVSAVRGPDCASPIAVRSSTRRMAVARLLTRRPEMLSDRPLAGRQETRPLGRPRRWAHNIAMNSRGADMSRGIAAALQRARAVLTRRPAMGLHDDAPATARWENGVRVVSSHANGTQVATDMPAELGGTGDRVTPGWLFRSGIAACAATSIAMVAADEGIELSALEVHVTSRSDARGLLGMVDAGGESIPVEPRDMEMRVRIAARGVDPARLQALVELGCRRSPIPGAVRCALPLGLHVETDAG
jgi:uncharacterized OsmC-like protein